MPEKFKPEIDRQIEELLRLGLIYESSSPQASPIVYVLKGKDGSRGVRLAVDYRYVNKYTVADALGPPDMHSVMQRIGSAKYISTFHGKSSYWTIPVNPCLTRGGGCHPPLCFYGIIFLLCGISKFASMIL